MNTPKWIKIDRCRLPKTGIIIAGSYRNGEWSMCSVSNEGFPRWCDSDRTHYCRLPNPPKQKGQP